MSDRLEPYPGHPYLEPEEIVERLREEFAVCEADREQGADDVGDMIAKLIQLNAPQEWIEARLAGRDRAYRIVIADDPDSENYLSFSVQPEDGPLIGYYSAQHQDATRPSLERCAAALNYCIVPP